MITKEYLQQELRRRIDGIKPGVETTTDLTIGEMKSILVLVDALNDYEKKYKDALERIKKYYDMGGQPSHWDLGYIFPELRESENEKIRTLLVALVQWAKTFNQSGLDTSTANKMLSYLEKQKEQKHAPDDLQKSFEAGQTSIVDNPEQYGLCKKTEWNEEDEKKILFLERLIKYHVPEGRYGYIDKSVTKLQAIAMLKSLRPQPQKLEDWTEEDERLLGNVLGCITLVQTYKACGDLKDFQTEYTGEELRSFVRSLKSRPRKQPHWKPSEEQMKHLERCFSHGHTSQLPNQHVLESLYNELKKLM